MIMIIDPFWISLPRNLIIKGVMFNQDTPWKNIFFISFKDVMTIKNKIYLKFSFPNSHKHFFHLV